MTIKKRVKKRKDISFRDCHQVFYVKISSFIDGGSNRPDKQTKRQADRQTNIHITEHR